MNHPAATAARPRRADAQRNVETILAAGLAVLSVNPDAGMAEIARASGLTRTTLYAHFASREELLDVLVGRAIADAVVHVDAGDPGQGPPDEALARVLSTSWQAVNRHRGVLATAAGTLGRERMAAHHEPLRARLLALIQRGQASGAFRGDVPAAWLLATYFALVHLAGDQVNAGSWTLPPPSRCCMPPSPAPTVPPARLHRATPDPGEVQVRLAPVTAGGGLRAVVALLLAGALVLHVFMLSHPHASPGAPLAVATTDHHEAAATGGHGNAGDGASSGAMAALCFSVLVGAASVGAVLLRPRSLVIRTTAAAGFCSAQRRPGWRPGGGVRDGPVWTVPLDAGVLLRV
jgi:AcrR family transcriptional regulator